MAQRTISPKVLTSIFKVVPILLGLPANRMWTDYDPEADVLYLSFDRPQHATDSRMRDDGVLLRYRDKKLIGITVFEASRR